MIRHMSVCAGAVSLAVAAGHTAADEIWGIDASTDSLYVLDTETGTVLRTLPRLHPDTGRFQTPISMAIRPSDGAIFVKNNSPSMDDGLITVDPVTGAATYIGGPTLDGSIAFDDAGTLYGVEGSEMATIDPETGAATVLGGGSLPRLFGLDYNSADGFLYGISGSIGEAPTLLRIDPDTGAAVETLPVSPAPTTSAVPGSLMFDSSGALLVSDLARNLYEVDPATGDVSNVRSADAGPQGMGLMIGAECYADCDDSGELDFFDFLCFQNEFAGSTAYADCDDSGELDFFDFLCFQNEFAAGCP